MIAGAGIILCALALVFYRPLTVSIFDPTYATTLGMRARWLQAGLVGAVAVTVVVSVQAVGAILVTAMLIIPPSSALLVSRRLPTALALSSAFGALSGLAGAYGSFLFEGFGTGPTMVLAAALIFAVTLAVGVYSTGGRSWTRRLPLEEARA